MSTTIDTTGTEAPRALPVPRHPYLHVAEALDDVRGLCAIVDSSAGELAPALRLATPPSVQAGAERARDGEPVHYVNPLALDRAGVQLAMLAHACEALARHLAALASDALEAGIGEHLAPPDEQ